MAALGDEKTRAVRRAARSAVVAAAGPGAGAVTGEPTVLESWRVSSVFFFCPEMPSAVTCWGIPHSCIFVEVNYL